MKALLVSLFGHEDIVESADNIHGHAFELMKMLLLKRLLDNTVKTGDGDILSIIVKHMMPYFKALHCTKYAIACFEFTAQQEYMLSEKMKVLVRQERFVNHLGRAETNKPMDLDLEHSNKHFKENFRLSLGEPTQKVLDRLSKSQDKVISIVSQFKQDFGLESFDAMRKVDISKYNGDVGKVASLLSASKVFEIHPGRTLYTQVLNEKSSQDLVKSDLVQLKHWFIGRMTSLLDQPFYKY